MSIVIAEKLESFPRYRERTKKASPSMGFRKILPRACLSLRSEGMERNGGYIYEDSDRFFFGTKPLRKVLYYRCRDDFAGIKIVRRSRGISSRRRMIIDDTSSYSDLNWIDEMTKIRNIFSRFPCKFCVTFSRIMARK